MKHFPHLGDKTYVQADSSSSWIQFYSTTQMHFTFIPPKGRKTTFFSHVHTSNGSFSPALNELYFFGMKRQKFSHKIFKFLPLRISPCKNNCIELLLLPQKDAEKSASSGSCLGLGHLNQTDTEKTRKIDHIRGLDYSHTEPKIGLLPSRLSKH